MPRECPYPGYYCAEGSIDLTEVSGTGMDVLQNLQKARVRVKKPYITHRASGQAQKCCTGTPGIIVKRGVQNVQHVPGTGMKVVQNLQKFWVRV